MDMNEATSRAIAAERAIAGLTVRELAERAGIPERSLMRILQAERDIKVNQIAQIADTLSLYPHEIIEHAENILARSIREAPNLATITPIETDFTPVDDLKAVASDASEDDGNDENFTD